MFVNPAVINLQNGLGNALNATLGVHLKKKYQAQIILKKKSIATAPVQLSKVKALAIDRIKFKDEELNRALGGDIIKIFPLLEDENNKWISAVEYRSGKYQVNDSLYGNFITNAVRFYLITLKKAIKCISLFLETPFEGGRHQQRVDKISC